jgi:tetratricopeptide (TPR) repeat protein
VPEFAPRFLAAPDGRAYFARGDWLRLIDTAKGQVIGRWHFPGLITRLTAGAAPGGIEVEVLNFNGPKEKFRRTLPFDPAAPSVPYWPSGDLQWIRAARVEAEMGAWAPTGGSVLSARSKLPPDVARKLVPETQEAVRRDPLSPWFQVRLGKLLRDAGDARATSVWRQALEVPSTDFTELLPISSFLDEAGEYELGRAGFERGYQDFFQRGSDPRLFTALIGRLFIYPLPANADQSGAAYRAELIDRFYLLSPSGEAAVLAWRIYADDLERSGHPDEARRWRARAADAASYQAVVLSDAPVFQLPTVMLDLAALLIPAVLIAAVLYILVLYRRYRPQRRFHQEAVRRGAAPSRGLVLFNLEYWSWRDRAAFLIILLAGWFAVGLASGYVGGILRVAASPISVVMGKLAGPVTIAFFEKLPETAERDLLLAVAYQQDGQRDKAERLYRQLPQYAESWNNLGVILRNAGRDQEARRAFEQALRLNPQLAEAALNLGRPPQGLWAEAHARYLPGQPMLAPPLARFWYGAFFGGQPAGLWLRAFAGPFAGLKRAPEIPQMVSLVFGQSRTQSWVILLFICAAGLALALVFWIPARDVTQPPDKSQIWWEVLFPGTSPVWSFFGGVVLVAWIYLGLQDALLFWKGTPGVVTAISLPNLVRAYAVPGADNARVLRDYINPSWVWVYLAPALLFAANLVLVLRRRKTLGSSL